MNPVFETIGAIACIVVIVLVVWGVISKIRNYESMEGTWYCKERNMQISLTDPNNSYFMENGERIQCRCETYMSKSFRGTVEVYCQEMEHAQYPFGKILFSAVILQYSKKSMDVYDRKSGRQYKLTRMDRLDCADNTAPEVSKW